jgi:hypothetical protein
MPFSRSWGTPRRAIRRSRYRTGKHYRATRIQRMWRRRRARKKTYRSSSQKTSNVKLGRRRGKLSLSKRVSNLEISSKKHYDYTLSRDTGVPIASYGAENGTQTNESFSQMLAIQPRNGDGTIPPVSGSARGTERNTREGMEIFVNKIRLRGRVLGIRPNAYDNTRDCLQSFTDAVTTTVYTTPYMNTHNTALKAACQSRVSIVVLRDNRASTIDPTTGLYEPNPLPVQPQNPLQGLFQLEGLTTNNTLDTMGLSSALRNYTNNRFTIVHTSVLTFDYLHPAKWFDITINVNKKAIYQPPPAGTGAVGNSDPVNINYLFYVSSVPNETAATVPFVLPDVSVDPYVNVNLLLQPNLQMLSSRTYFTES